jgi:hypothetical protein
MMAPAFAQVPTSGPGAAQIAAQAAVGPTCPIGVTAADASRKDSYKLVYGPACSQDERIAANAALSRFDVSAWQSGLQVSILSPTHPELNGIYSIDAASQARITSVATYIAVNNRFPAGQTKLIWKDTSGRPHEFTSPGAFLSFATAIADYVYKREAGISAPGPVAIP